MTTPGEWLGHRDLCPIQWGEPCDCEDAQPADEAALADQSDAAAEAEQRAYPS